ncbi:hypothetical protein [Streptomyces cinerochromogenes]|uniref:hypothetical protein n=1 Tax=Streptomyces cinerochromogenes TaxID=66422 RepID=UPI0019AF9983|nr:hypothetical protein [Streptomyces cinerochromogenes]GGS78720.1 hypothetical protein GCM10010206_46450 [Streptomyces cinerochromogenes]
MEQRIGSSSKPSKAEPLKAEPVTGAGFDPAYIPGITGPTPREPVSKEPGPAQATAEELKAETAVAEKPARPADEREADADGPADGLTDAPADEPVTDGPVFEASDRRARIVADRRGVRLSLDEEACEFRWDEIAAVETESPRFGKRYTITVHTPDRRWYPIEIEAAARSRFKEWDEQLDAVLDAYFEEA